MSEERSNVIDLSSPTAGTANPEGISVGIPRLEPIPGVHPAWPPNVLHPQGVNMANRTANRHTTMDLGNHIGSAISHKEPAMISPLMCGAPPPVPGQSQPGDPEIQAQLYSLENHYRLQADIITQQFNNQRRLLAEEQIKMQEYFKLMMAQRQQQELLEQQHQQHQREEHRRDNEQREIHKLDQIKHKSTDEESAIASSEVKQKLRQCLLEKTKNSPPEFRQWASLEQHSPPTSGLSPPLSRPGHLLNRFVDYPLRKTVSEPNLFKKRMGIRPIRVVPRNSPHSHRRDPLKKRHHLATSEPNLKVRLALKQKMIERRSSPLLRRKERLSLLAAKRTNTPVNIDTMLQCDSNPDSGPNSPQTGTNSQNSSTDTPSQEKESGPPLRMISNMVMNQSLPNISIGQPRDKLPKADLQNLSLSASEAEIRSRAAAAAQCGLPLVGYPFYPTVLEGGEMMSTQAAIMDAQIKSLQLANSTGALPMGTIPHQLMNAASLPESSQPHIQRPPLNRTNSAPLPLPGHLLLQHPYLLHKQQEQLLKESQKNYFVKQKLQSTLLHRSTSKGQMENVDETAENRLLAAGAKEDGDIVVVDDHKEPQASPCVSRREHQPFPRQSAFSGGSPPITTPILEKEGPSTEGEAEERPQAGPSSTAGSSSTAIAYDLMMLRHECVCQNSAVHPENPERLHSILSHLDNLGLIQQCQKIKSRKATPEELRTCHSDAYVHMYSSNLHRLDRAVFETFLPRFCKLPCGGIGVDSDTVWNELYTPQVTKTATGCVIDLAFHVARGDVQNGFALVRPPGHHAEDQQAMGFCFFNSIAVATKLLLDRLQMKRILIVDWDVHHGNSTQQLFYTDPRVLYISIHRHDNGNFFPGTGAPGDCGIEKGVGYNINVAFAGNLNPPMGDAEYLAAFRTIVMPIAREFSPEVVLVSAGFDAAAGHAAPLGGYLVSPSCFGYMTQQLQTLAGGRLALVLEGGYDVQPTCRATEACLKALLKQPVAAISEEELCRKPCAEGAETLENTIKCQASYWPCVTRQRALVGISQREAARLDSEEADTVSAFASLSVLPEHKPRPEMAGEVPGPSHSDPREQPMEES